jgi:hypothetical protein
MFIFSDYVHLLSTLNNRNIIDAIKATKKTNKRIIQMKRDLDFHNDDKIIAFIKGWI